MFPRRYFARRFFAVRYWPESEGYGPAGRLVLACVDNDTSSARISNRAGSATIVNSVPCP